MWYQCLSSATWMQRHDDIYTPKFKMIITTFCRLCLQARSWSWSWSWSRMALVLVSDCLVSVSYCIVLTTTLPDMPNAVNLLMLEGSFWTPSCPILNVGTVGWELGRRPRRLAGFFSTCMSALDTLLLEAILHEGSHSSTITAFTLSYEWPEFGRFFAMSPHICCW